MTATFKSAVFDNAILSAVGIGTGSAGWQWTGLAQGASYDWCVLLTGSSGNGLVKTTSVLYSDLSTQVANGGGYTTGGYNTGTTACSLSSSTAQFKAASTSTWGATASFSTATAVHAYGATGPTAGNRLMCYNDLTNATGTSQTVTSGTLTLTWNSSTPGGVFTITISAEA